MTRSGAGSEALFDEVMELALQLAQGAGRLLREHLEARSGNESGGAEASLEFKGRRELVTAADKRAETLLVEGIQARFPDHGILAEEGVLTPAGVSHQDSEFTWVLDPLDGTTNFVHGHPFFSVSIGVLRQGKPWLGVIHAPMLGGREGGDFFHGGPGSASYLNGQPIQVSRNAHLHDAIVATGFSYNRNEEGVNTNLGNFGRALMEVRGIRRCGSAALDLAQVAAGRYDAFWEMYLKPYDVAAGMAIVLGAGGSISTLGMQEDPIYCEEILASNGVIDAALLELLEGRLQGRQQG
jgi:myo-inositol-1(or 4)-monophosphatase